MNPVTMIIINPRTEHCPSWGPPVLKSANLWTELWGSADYENCNSKQSPTTYMYLIHAYCSRKGGLDSLPNNKFLYLSRLKELADDKINVTKKLDFFLEG